MFIPWWVIVLVVAIVVGLGSRVEELEHKFDEREDADFDDDVEYDPDDTFVP
jgi:hypothetical protein